MIGAVNIQILLPTGNPLEEFHSYMPNLSGRVIKMSYNQVILSKYLKTLKRPGIYLLLNKLDKKVYVGEATNLTDRILHHLRTADKKFADTVICFYSTDENFSVSHIKYLERKTLEWLKESKEYQLVNRKKSNAGNDSPIMNTEVGTYFENLRTILSMSEFPDLLGTPDNKKLIKKQGSNAYQMQAGNCFAKARYADGGIVVIKGSEMKLKTAVLSQNCADIRQMLIKKNIVSLIEGKYIFNKNYTFNSFSAAATVIAGCRKNGRTTWKDQQGITVRDLGL